MSETEKKHSFNFLFQQIDISILVYFRIIFGAIMAWEVVRYFAGGRIPRYYIDPPSHFTYFGFDWVQPWPGDLMYVHFFALGILALFIMIGFMYRISTVLFFLGFTYVFLLEQANYLNHFYLVVLVSFLLIFVSPHRSFSMDSIFRKKIKSDTVPSWQLWLLRAQIGVPYFFGGIAKLNPDWLIRAEPLRHWLADRTDFPIIGNMFTEESVVYLFVYGSFLVDLLAVPFLLWRRTRLPAYAIIVVFHLMNAQLFNIGIFPWFMIGATLLFFSPDWPRQIIFRFFKSKISDKTKRPYIGISSLSNSQKTIVVLLAIFIVFQVSLPLRHYFYPGNVSWTEEGHNFSWHMKLRDKDTTFMEFYITDPVSGGSWTPIPALTDRQYDKMSTRPDLILQYVHMIADDFREKGYDQIEVRVKVESSLNGRDTQLLIDPDIDLAKQPREWIPHRTWIVPLN